MPSLLLCNGCGSKNWSAKPDEGGFRITTNVLIDGERCPRCGIKVGRLGENPSSEEIPPTTLENWSQAESADAETVDCAVQLLNNREFTKARVMFSDVASRAPKAYRSVFAEGGNLYVKCWDHSDFQFFKDAARNGMIKEQGSPVLLRCAYPKAFYHLAFINLENGEPQSALKNLKAGMRLEPDNPLFYAEMATAYDALGDPAKSIECLEKGIQVRAWMSNHVRSFLFRKKGARMIDMDRLDEAEESLGQSLTFEPDNPITLKELDLIAYRRRGGAAVGTAQKRKVGDSAKSLSTLSDKSTFQPKVRQQLYTLEQDFRFTLIAASDRANQNQNEASQELIEKSHLLGLQIAGMRRLHGESSEATVTRLVDLGLEREYSTALVRQVVDMLVEK